MSDSSNEPVYIHIAPRTTGLFLAAVVIVLDVGYVSTTLWHHFFSPEHDFGLYRFFQLGQEANLPTYVSALYLLFAGFLLAVIARFERRHGSKLASYWMGLSIGFFLMSFDEATQIHEGVIGAVAAFFFDGGGTWHYSWYLPFIPIVLLIGALYIPFLKRIPSRYALLFVLAGTVFVGGAIGIEMVEAYLQFHHIEGGAVFSSMLVEESCEMLGVTLFIYALLSYIATHRITCQLSVHAAKSTSIQARQEG